MSTHGIRHACAACLVIGLGSIAGGLARWGTSELWLAATGGGFPFGTLFVNITGSFLVGLYATISAPSGRLPAGPLTRHFIVTGLCGGYTTFSIFSLEALELYRAGGARLAGVLVLLSLAAWLVAVWSGHLLAIRLNGAVAARDAR